VKTLVMLFCMLSTLARADAPDDYASGLAVTTTQDAAFYRVALPAAVYEGARRADLGDLRVFNADGAAVPFALLSPPAATITAGAKASLPLFPLKTEPSSPALSGLTLSLERSAAGASLRVTTQDGKLVNGARLVGYVLDASGVTAAIKAIELEWPPASGSMTRHAHVDASDDLATWRTVVSDAALIDLAFEGRRLLKNRIELSLQKARYYRIVWNASEPPLEITAAVAELGDVRVEPTRQWRDVAGTTAPEHVGDYEFDLGGMFPIDRVAVDLPEINSVVPAELYTRSSVDTAWQPRTSLLAYRLRGTEQDLMPAPIAIPRTTARYWMLRVDPRSGGVGNGAPHLRAGGPSQEVIFAARGSGPFIVAYGNAIATSAALPAATLVPDYGNASAPPIAVATVADAPQSLGGASRLSAPVDVRRALLWAALVFGVAAMGWMAWRLSAQLNAETQASGRKHARAGGDNAPPES
jgi:hypothetical protein